MKISISVKNPVDNIKVAHFISKLTGCAISTAKKQLEQGKAGFFYTTELFLNDYPERVKEILKLINYFDDLDIDLYIIEIGHDKSWGDVDLNNLDNYRITVSVLRNIITETKSDFS